MGMAKRALTLYLIAVAIAVAFALMLTPVFHDGSPEYPAWRVLNWFMAAGVVVVLAVNIRRLNDSPTGEAVTARYLGARFASYGSIVLTMLFFWGWFWTLNPESETGEAVTSHLVYFPAMDALYVVLSLSTGRRLWQG